ncbi:MAG: extracellular solute-binding protein [Clostridia bacterium]
MKKFLSLLLALVLMLSVTVTASAQEVVKFWTHTNNAWNASYEELIAEFEAANPEIKIEYTNFPYADFEAKMQSSLMAGEPGADVYEAWGGWMLNFASSGVLSEIPSVFLEELLKDVYEPVMGTLQYQGKYYGAPLELNSGYG